MASTITVSFNSLLSPVATESFKDIGIALYNNESFPSESSTSSDSRQSSGDTDNTCEGKDDKGSVENVLSQTEYGSQKTKRRRKNKEEKFNTKALKFPPCYVCNGRSSGSHFGVNSCEACKGFFRRYLSSGKQFKCSKDNNCVVTFESRSNCPSCRLQKCLDLGMAKEKSKLGRYSLAKRTEAIQSMKMMEEERIDTTENNSNDGTTNLKMKNDTDELIETLNPKTHATEKEYETNDYFKETLVHDLVEAMKAFRPFGLNIVTDTDIKEAMDKHYESYELRLKIYGERKAVPQDVFEKMYKEYGIDLDDRVSLLKDCLPHIEETMERYCAFAKIIPGFQQLSVKDQSELLKASRCDFFACICYKGFCPQRRFCIFHDMGYHMNEIVGKFNSEHYCLLLEKTYSLLRKLSLRDPERALLMAITVMFSDRCKLEGTEKVREIQDKLTVTLWKQLSKIHGKDASKVFGKITDLLLLMREGSDVYLQEYKKLCNDDILVDAAPILTEFLLDD